MNAYKLTFVTIITVFAFILILSVLHTLIENINVDATTLTPIPRCPDDITGKWYGDDGGTYWIRQIGVTVMWFGTSGLEEGTHFSNVFHGVRELDEIRGEWADIPMGRTMAHGEIDLTCTQEGGIDKLRSGFRLEGLEVLNFPANWVGLLCLYSTEFCSLYFYRCGCYNSSCSME